MSYKSIDLQTSLPRAAEMTPLAQHQHQRGASEQAMLGQQAIKNAERQAQRKTKTESAAKSDIKDRDARGQDGGTERRNGRHPEGDAKAPEDSIADAPHPFKGRHIDFSG
ncbi:hypothetical protein ACFPVX_12465 [Cohnella faecalis]|uniref:RNA polymerase subunit sigma n=1 Tax=Cohnella faecalis TaxID=2315694 RepID=A0A398CM29_9BACL|nr:hypothetical protein [Cohnella faecalis]RIE03310.1 hypothetical protein D3H35_11520 [Cohnella faecalis]